MSTKPHQKPATLGALLRHDRTTLSMPFERPRTGALQFTLTAIPTSAGRLFVYCY